MSTEAQTRTVDSSNIEKIGLAFVGLASIMFPGEPIMGVMQTLMEEGHKTLKEQFKEDEDVRG